MEHPSQNRVEIKVILFCLQQQALHVLVKPVNALLNVAFPGSEVQPALSLEENAVACLKQALPAQEIYLEQLFTYSDRVSQPATRLITIVYYALLPNDKSEMVYAPMQWIPVIEQHYLPDDEQEMLAYALRRLRYKLEYSAVGFELLPETFSLSELQRTYEIILDETLDKRNFRRRILQANIIEATPYRKTGEGRPATLYRYRSDAVAEIKARRLFP